MKEQMNKIALLSLSLILTSAYSVSIVLPSLLQHFSEYTTAQVEILISAPSFAITAMIVLNAWLSRYMKDRPMIVRSASFIGQRHGTGVCTGISGGVCIQDFPGDRDWAH